MSRMGASIHVRQASPGEAAVVAWIVRTSFKEYRKGRRKPLSARLSAEKVRRQLRSGEKQYALAQLERKPVGAIAIRRKGRVLVFGPVGVIPKHRAQGVGVALLRWAEERAAAEQCLKLKAEVLWGLNSLARYYRKRGFEIKRTSGGKAMAIKRVAGIT